MSRALLLALVAASGCTNVSRCKSGTLLVHLTLSGATADADQLVVSVTVGDAMPLVNPPQPHTPGVASGNIEIDFSSGYPQGKVVLVDVRALQGGAQLGEAETVPVALQADCSSTSLILGLGADLAASGDLSGGDAAQVVGDDLAGVDLAAVDLAAVDLSTVVAVPDLANIDLQGCVPVAENCFNGVDDDCDGLIDCADTADCSSVAMCVPTLTGASYGTVLTNAASACPQAGATSQLLYSFASAPYSCYGCTATALGTPSLPIYSDSSVSCNMADQATNVGSVSTSTCASLSVSNQFELGGITGVTCVLSGTSTLDQFVITTDKFCADSSVGAGCPSGNVCAPQVGSAVGCILVPSTTSCPASYPKAIGLSTWYGGYSGSPSCPACSTANNWAYDGLNVYSGSCGGTLVTSVSGVSGSPKYNLTCIAAGTYYFELGTGSSFGCGYGLTATGAYTGTNGAYHVCCLH